MSSQVQGDPGAASAAAATGTPEVRSRTGRMPRQARRKQLLAAAHQVFVAQGYHSTSMDDIAVRAGVSKPVLYQHFPSKLELYLALLDQHTGALLDQVESALASTTDNKARVGASFAAYFDFVHGDESADGHGAYRLVFESDLRAEPAVRERIERNLADVSEAIARTIAEDTGASDDEAHLLSVGLAGMAEVAARWWMSSEPRVPKDRAVELLSGLVWRGLSGSPRRPA